MMARSALNRKSLYENILASLDEGIIVCDADFKVIILNQCAEGLLGVSRSQITGAGLSEYIGAPGNIHSLVEHAFLNSKIFSDNDLIIKNRDGSYINISATASPLIEEDGRTVGTVLVLRDIRRIKSLEEDLRRSDRIGIMGTVAAGLAHEIKNPLGGIKGAAQLLQKELGHDRFSEYTAIIIKEADRVNRLVGELLDLAHPKKLSFLPLNIHKILDDTALLMNERIISGGITVIKEYDPSLPRILGDTERLTQVFLNIIKNAIEAVSRGGWVMITTRISSDFRLIEDNERKGVISVEISDNGKGMKKEVLGDIFTPFFTTKDNGSGLGLAVSHRLIKEHKGNIRVRSFPGQGSTFTINLPVN